MECYQRPPKGLGPKLQWKWAYTVEWMGQLSVARPADGCVQLAAFVNLHSPSHGIHRSHNVCQPLVFGTWVPAWLRNKNHPILIAILHNEVFHPYWHDYNATANQCQLAGTIVLTLALPLSKLYCQVQANCTIAQGNRSSPKGNHLEIVDLMRIISF